MTVCAGKVLIWTRVDTEGVPSRSRVIKDVTVGPGTDKTEISVAPGCVIVSSKVETIVLPPCSIVTSDVKTERGMPPAILVRSGKVMVCVVNEKIVVGMSRVETELESPFASVTNEVKVVGTGIEISEVTVLPGRSIVDIDMDPLSVIVVAEFWVGSSLR